MADWEKEKQASIVNRWLVIEPKATKTSNGSVLTKELDGSIIVTGRNTNGVVTITAETDLTGISGIRLEVLTDSRLPKKGPGRASDGNFVLNELELSAAPKADPKQVKPIKLANALADFSQDGLKVGEAIDGSADDPGNGWAIAPVTGISHWATFETSSPIGGPGGTVLTFKMHHKYDNRWTLGRFRLSITSGKKPVGLSLPEEFRAILASAPELRTEAQRNVLLGYFRRVDDEYRHKADALSASKAPLPNDPKLKGLRDLLEFAQRPSPARSGLGYFAARSGDERTTRNVAAAHRRPGYYVGLDQQPGVPV